MSFKFDSQYCFLTYAQSNLSHEQIYAKLQSIAPVLWARICTEQHDDGGLHQHCVAKWGRRVQSRVTGFLDIDGRHPNIQTVRSITKSLAYVTKDGQFTDFGDVPADKSKRTYDEALALVGSPNESEYLKACLEARIPFQYAKRFRELEFADTTNTIEQYTAEDAWQCARLLEEALPENSCAVLIGPSGIGKSVWAKKMAPKPTLWVTHMDVLRMYRPSYHKSIIFDDMSFSHMPLQAQIHLTDWTDARQIHCRYGYATIPAKTVKIFTCNEKPFTDHPAIQRRITEINLY